MGMKASRGLAADDWAFDGQTITVRIPMQWKRRGGRKVIIAPEGGDAWPPAKPRPDEILIRALARAISSVSAVDAGATCEGAESTGRNATVCENRARAVAEQLTG